jgi:hypothetical protein
MSEKPIYIYLGNGSFRLWNERRKRLQLPGKLDRVRTPPESRAGRRFAEDEHLLRHNDGCEADMLSVEEPDAATWESLREFIVAERDG